MSKINDAPKLLMPKATAVWLIDNTTLTFEQISEFTGLHKIEVQAIADEDVGLGIVGRDPIKQGETTQEELDKAIADENHIMKYARSELPSIKVRAKGPRYTPVSKRSDKPDAISWILKHHPEISDAQIMKLVGTTKPTIAAIRDRTHQNISNIRPKNPADLGLCTHADIEKASDKGLRAQGKDPEAIKAQKLKEQQEELSNSSADNTGDEQEKGGFDFSNFLSSGISSGSGNAE